MPNCDILSIDAWKNDVSWEWNDHRRIATFDIPDEILDNTRKLLNFLRKNECLDQRATRHVSVDRIEQDPFLIEILDRNNSRPILAIQFTD